MPASLYPLLIINIIYATPGWLPMGCRPVHARLSSRGILATFRPVEVNSTKQYSFTRKSCDSSMSCRSYLIRHWSIVILGARKAVPLIPKKVWHIRCINIPPPTFYAVDRPTSSAQCTVHIFVASIYDLRLSSVLASIVDIMYQGDSVATCHGINSLCVLVVN